MPPSAVATVSKALDILISEPERIDQLWKNTHKMKKAFDEMGYDTGTSETPIIPIVLGEDLKTFMFWKLLYENGIFTNPVVSPAVEPGHALLRTSYMATHTNEELDQVLEIFHKLGKKFGLIN
jgi:7-keto-8-aminopelargonate synthetase-like enzyme